MTDDDDDDFATVFLFGSLVDGDDEVSGKREPVRWWVVALAALGICGLWALVWCLTK